MSSSSQTAAPAGSKASRSFERMSIVTTRRGDVCKSSLRVNKMCQVLYSFAV